MRCRLNNNYWTRLFAVVQYNILRISTLSLVVAHTPRILYTYICFGIHIVLSVIFRFFNYVSQR